TVPDKVAIPNPALRWVELMIEAVPVSFTVNRVALLRSILNMRESSLTPVTRVNFSPGRAGRRLRTSRITVSTPALNDDSRTNSGEKKLDERPIRQRIPSVPAVPVLFI